MSDFGKIATFESEVHALTVVAVLLERQIPHVLKSYHDSAYDGLFQATKGWGHLEASLDRREEIQVIIRDLAPEGTYPNE